VSLVVSHCPRAVATRVCVTLLVVNR